VPVNSTNTKASQITIVFVFLGEKLPLYASLNIERTARLFPHIEVVLVTDRHRRLQAGSNVTQFECVDLMIKYSSVFRSLKLDPKFRGGFWLHVLARYFALLEYSSIHPGNQLLYIESDVWIAQSFPFEQLAKLSTLAFPMSSLKQGVASTLYIPSLIQIKLLVDFISKEISRDPSLNDNELLGLFMEENYPLSALTLPSLFPNEKNIQHHLHGNLDSDIEQFNGVFDAATWGQFLTGLDPMNSLGKRYIYMTHSHHALNPKGLSFSFDSNKQQLSVTDGNETMNIHSLHIHSKDIRIFKGDKILKKRVNQVGDRTLTEILYLMYFKILFHRLKNKILGN
jgi:hypothetical protein